MLHDIGRSKTQGIMHGVEGAKIATELGLPEAIVNIIERHLGAGIPKEEAMIVRVTSERLYADDIRRKNSRPC